MLTGNFSPAEVAKLGNLTQSGGPPGQVNQTLFPGGIIPASQIDPNMQALMKLYPAANAQNPNATGGYNYVQAETFNQNNFCKVDVQRVDYNISDNTGAVRPLYNLQKETQQFPVGLWWRNGNQVPYPTPIEGKNSSQSVTTSLTHVFSPTMTNEFVFGYTFIGFPNVFQDRPKVDRIPRRSATTTRVFTKRQSSPDFTSFGGGRESGSPCVQPRRLRSGWPHLRPLRITPVHAQLQRHGVESLGVRTL